MLSCWSEASRNHRQKCDPGADLGNHGRPGCSSDAEVESVDTADFDDLSMKEAMSVVHRTVETYLGG